MAPRRRVRKFLLGLALFAFFILLLAASLPLWQPWLLKPLSNRHGLHYSTYERVGYARFALIDVAYTNSTTTVTAKRLEAFVPTVWLFKKFTTGQNPPNFLRMDDWLLTQQSPGSNAPPNKPVSPYNTVQTINETLSTLHRWIPQALLTNGAMQANALTVRIPNARWQNGSLTAEMNLPKYGKSLALQLKSDKAGSSDILIDSPDLELSSTIHVSQIPTALSLQATNLWRGNPVILTGSFRPDAKLPEQATLQAEHFDLPATMLKPVNYQALTGSLFAHWESNHFVLDLSANAQPEKSEPSQLPPLDLTLHAKGDTESATIETARMSAPWLIAELTQRATIHFQGPLLTNQVTFSLVSDLSRQPLAQLQGMIHGQVIFSPTTNHFPEIAFDLTGSNVIAPKVNLRTLAFHGQLLWPVLALKEANVELADGSKASLKGEADLKAKSIREGEAQLNGTFGREWLPTGYSFSNSVLSAHFSGPLKDLSHSGKINLIHFTSPDLKPLDLQLNWNGRATNSLHSEILLSADASSLAFNGTVQASTNQATLIVDILTLQTNGQPVLQLEHPFHAFLHPNDSQGSGSNHTYSVKLDGLNWIGGDKQVSLQGDIHWPEHGNLTNTIHEVDSGLFNGFLLKPLPNLKINDLLLSANWSNGPARFEARLSSEGTTPRGIPVAISGSISGDGGGISISNLLVSTKGAPIFSATGFLPVIIRPDHPTNLVDLLHDKPLDLQAITQTNSAFWEEIASLTGVVLQDPHLNLNVSGTWDLPQGKITLRARQIKLPETKSKLPVMDNLQLEMSLDKSVARIDNLFFAVQGQPVRASGELPLSEEVWKKLIQKRTLPDLLQARAHILVENAQVAAFAPLLPTLLTPQGVINLNLAILPGLKLDGKLTLDGVQTRPLGALGPLRNIQAQMQFLERAVTLKIATTVGGSLVYIDGNADLRGEEWMHGDLPPFNVKVHGSNVPLARQPDLILRSDLDLAINRTNNSQPLISGTLHLRNSFFLRDLRGLVPGRIATPAERPPYFSIDIPFLADWRLNLNVVGTRFLRAQSPLFNGEISSNLKLHGTLKEPAALGDIKIDSGLVQFPFGNLQVTSGFISLTSENPYSPQLQILAASRQFGYDIRMDVTGPADRPVIQFTSFPPLSSQQIILMLSAGQLPRSDYSLSPEQRAQGLAIYLGKSLLSKYGFAGSSQRLTVRSGTEISQQGKPTYAVEYKLTERWSIIGEYDRFGDFNGSFKWLIYTR